MSKKNDVMIDIETMGTKAFSSIVSIGAVFFDMNTGETGETFYTDISLDSCFNSGLVADAGTIQWWINQDVKAKKVFNGFKEPLPVALEKFITWLHTHSDKKHLKPWGNGATFDIQLLENAMQACSIKDYPWEFWNVRDVRTLVALGEGISDAKNTIPRAGVYHNALDDSLHQVKYCHEIWKTLRSGK